MVCQNTMFGNYWCLAQLLVINCWLGGISGFGIHNEFHWNSVMSVDCFRFCEFREITRALRQSLKVSGSHRSYHGTLYLFWEDAIFLEHL